MNSFFLATIAILTLFAQQISFAKSNGEYDVFLLIGQSNMAGRGYMIESDTLSNIKGVYILNKDGEVVEARNPLNQYSTIGKSYSMQQISPAFSFSKRVHEVSGRKILLVLNARGGSSISEWAPDDTTGFYAEAVRRTKQAMEFGELKGVLWHQGCADSSDSKRELYMGRLKGLVKALRNDLCNEDLYFVAGELAYWLRSSPAFNEMLHSITYEIPNSDYISADGANIRTAGTKDPHFSREGQILLGERYAEKVLGNIYGKQWKKYQKKEGCQSF